MSKLGRFAATVTRLSGFGLTMAIFVLAVPVIQSPSLARAAQPAPAWSLTGVTYPTNFTPGSEGSAAIGPGILLVASNVGGANNAAEFVIQDTLPAGLTPVAGAASGGYAVGKGHLTCETTGQTVTCSGGGPGQPPAPPGQLVEAYIPVAVAPGAVGEIIDEAVIEGGAEPAPFAVPVQVTSELPSFGFLPGQAGFSYGSGANLDGTPATQAGSTPNQLNIAMNFPSRRSGLPLIAADGGVKDITVDLPQGAVVNPLATPTRCTESQLETVETRTEGRGCPFSSQIGTVNLLTSTGGAPVVEVNPLWNMVPPPGKAAEFAVNALNIGIYVHIGGSVKSDGTFQLTASSDDILSRPNNPVLGVDVALWGNPSAQSHDEQRAYCSVNEGRSYKCPVERRNVPLLTLPSACSSGLTASARADSWLNPTLPVTDTAENRDSSGAAIGVDGCNETEFRPTISSQPTTSTAESPSGLVFDLHQPQQELPEASSGTVEICKPGDWSGGPDRFSYQWLRNGVGIAGANAPSYAIQSEDVGAFVQCEVTAEDSSGGVGRAVTAEVAVAPLDAAGVIVSETPIVNSEVEGGGAVLYSCEAGGTNGAVFSYEWFENGLLAAGQTESTYLVTESELPVTVQCRVYATNGHTGLITVSSPVSSVPSPSPPLPDVDTAPEIYAQEEVVALATANLKDARVSLPMGMTLNASAANGLGSCDEDQIGYQPSEGKIRFSETAQTCPDAAKVGSVEVTTPLLDHHIAGGIYVAKPYANPFNSLLAIYVAIEDEQTGTIAKLAGKVEPDVTTGQLTAVFTENPELPLKDIDLDFFPGDRGVLTTPLTCGTQTTTSTLTPWSTPEGADAHPSDSFDISAGCSSSEGAAPKGYFLRAGTQSPLSGAYSPFVLRIERGDGIQHITGIETTLPPGLLGKLAGISYCPESGIAQAKSREVPEKGKLEQSSPSCPQSSEVGTVQVTAGSGKSPIPVSGHAYLAGPYKGAPLSLVVIVPAVAGPFDLGTVVDRVALNVGEYDARIHAVSDPLPTIREGIPFDVRSIELRLNRPSFTLNPTSCEAMQIEGSVSTQAGQSQSLANRFQVGECGRLAFKPKLQISLKGPTKRTGHPALKAVVTYPKQGPYANIARAQVNLPHSEFLDQGNIGKACTKVLIAVHACPAKSIYGKARAWSPLLEKPLEGPVYLVGGYGYKLPALVAELDGQIRILLVGKIDTGKNRGIRNTFEAVPDAPVERFVLEMKGGRKYGLLENSENLCSKPQKAGTQFTAQSGKTLSLSPAIANSCHHKKKSAKGKD